MFFCLRRNIPRLTGPVCITEKASSDQIATWSLMSNVEEAIKNNSLPEFKEKTTSVKKQIKLIS